MSQDFAGTNYWLQNDCQSFALWHGNGLAGSEHFHHSNQKSMKITTAFFVVAIAAAITLSARPASAQDQEAAATPDDAGHSTLHTDANTTYWDVAGNKITPMQFMTSVQGGAFTAVPEVKDGKLISLKLKAADKTTVTGTKAPQFAAIDMAGHLVDLKALKGKTVVLNFWFIGCAPCRSEMPELNNLVAKYKDNSNVVFLAITFEAPKDVKAFLKTHDFKCRILAGQNDIIDQYKVTNYPTSIVIDPSGSIAFSLSTYDGSNAAQLDSVIATLSKK